MHAHARVKPAGRLTAFLPACLLGSSQRVELVLAARQRLAFALGVLSARLGASSVLWNFEPLACDEMFERNEELIRGVFLQYKWHVQLVTRSTLLDFEVTRQQPEPEEAAEEPPLQPPRGHEGLPVSYKAAARRAATRREAEAAQLAVTRRRLLLGSPEPEPEPEPEPVDPDAPSEAYSAAV